MLRSGVTIVWAKKDFDPKPEYKPVLNPNGSESPFWEAYNQHQRQAQEAQASDWRLAERRRLLGY